jgi:catechol 2,3-dioxygenase-like lactoylglutathione lyase family enzyme
MTVDLFACLPVTDLARAEDWYGRLLGSGPSFRPNDAEAVWEVAEHRYLYAELLPEHAGHGRATLVVEDLDERVTAMAGRGLKPVLRETYDNGVRKIIYRDPDGNEIGFGGAPAVSGS